MIKLRLVGPSADLQHLVYSNKKTGKKGSHLVAVDEDLFDVLEDVVRRRRRGEGGAGSAPEPQARRVSAPRVESKIPPREVQRMLRAGRTPEQVARSAQVPVAWVEQFLTPVLYERQGMVREARRAWLSKQRLGESGSPIGDSVVANLRSRHVRLSDAELENAWDAHRVEGQPWTITLRFRFRGREQRAIWKYDPVRKQATAGNRLGADLGWVTPGRRTAVPPARAAGKTEPEKPARTRRPAGKKTTARKKTAARKKTTGRKKTAARKKTTGRRSSARVARRR